MSNSKLIDATKSATINMNEIVNGLKDLVVKKGKLEDSDFQLLGQLFALGECFRRLVIYFLYVSKQHKTVNLSFDSFVKKHFKTSKSESYKQVRRTEMELYLFDNDLNKLGTITNNSILDCFISFKSGPYKKHIPELWQMAVEATEDESLVTVPELRELVRNKCPGLIPNITNLFVDDEATELTEWNHTTEKEHKEFQEYSEGLEVDDYTEDWLHNLFVRNKIRQNYTTDEMKNKVKLLNFNELKELKNIISSTLRIITKAYRKKKIQKRY